jgi:hypothetical protein
MASEPTAAVPAEPGSAPRSTLTDPWAWLSVLSVLLLVLKSLGAPLGEPVAEDFDFLRRAVLSDSNPLFDGGGSTAFWRPLAHQLYYDAFGRLMLEHPGAIAAIHAALLALSALLLYRTFRIAFSGPVAAAIASFPFMAESTRTLIAWPSHFVDLGAFLFSSIALHEGARRRLFTALPSLVAALLCKEVAVVTAILLPFMPGVADSRHDRVRWIAGAGLVVVTWAAVYSLVRQRAGLELPHGLERDPALLHIPVSVRLAWSIGNSLRAVFSLARLPGRGDRVVLGAAGLIVLAAVIALARDGAARRRLAGARGWIAWGTAWFLLGAGSLTSIYPLWSPNRSQFASAGIGVAMMPALATIHPGLAGAMTLVRLGALVAAPGAQRWVTPEAEERGAFIDFRRITRLQRLMRDTRHALVRAYPMLQDGATVGFRNLPLASEYAFGGAYAVQAWYRNTTLRWVRVDDSEGDGAGPVTLVDYQPPPHATVALLDPGALRALKSGYDTLSAGHATEALVLLDHADSLQHDRSATILLGEIAGRRAGALLALRRFPEAEEQARAALNASRLDVGAWYVLAVVSAARRDRAAAMAAADSMLAVHPNDPDGLALKDALLRVRKR